MKRVQERQDGLRNRLRSGQTTVLPATRRYAKLVGNAPTRLGLEVPTQLMGTDAGQLTATFRISDETQDRDGDVVMARGAQIDDYMRNPVVLWAHGTDPAFGSMPIGKALAVNIHRDHLTATLQFDNADARAVQIFSKIQRGYLSATSIGFMPLEGEELKQGASDYWWPGYKFTSWCLLEISCVPTPANPRALIQRGKRMTTAQDEAAALLGMVEAVGRDIRHLKTNVMPRFYKEIELQEREGAAAEKLSEMPSEDVFMVMKACANILAARFANEPPSIRSAIKAIVSDIEKASSMLNFY